MLQRDHGSTYRLFRGDKKLTPIGIGSCISHTQSIRLVMLQRAELILEFLPPNTFSTSTISQRITTLNHKLPDHSMENGVVVISLLRMHNEVLDGFRGSVWEEANMDISVCCVNNGCCSSLR